MRRYIAFLRGINVGGHRVTMDRLRELFTEMKFANVATFIASGNVIFDTAAADAVAVEKRIETHLKRALGYEVATFLRTPNELASIATACPFAAEDVEEAGHSVHVAFLRDALSDQVGQNLRSISTSIDEFQVKGREFYWLCRGKFTDSLVRGNLLAKTVVVPLTMRNVKTIRKLCAMHPG
jgi:uncharacterized protein (DUF1697 family)